MNITAKFQLYRPNGLIGVDFFSLHKFSISVAITTNEIAGVWTKIIYLIEDHSIQP